MKCFDPLLIPILKANGFESVSTFSNVRIKIQIFHALLYCFILCYKGANILMYDVLLFPVHKMQHWCLMVGKRSMNF